MSEREEMYTQWREIVYGFLLRMCRNPDLAEDLTQETFLRAFKEMKHFRGESDISTWLCAIAKNLYFTTLRRPPPVPLEDEHVGALPDFTDALIDADRAMTAQRLLHALPEPYREVFTLRTFCELSHGQIGELFDKTESWSRVTYYRARTMLAERLKEAESDEGKL